MTFLEMLAAVLVGSWAGVLLAMMTEGLLELLGRRVGGVWNDYVRSWWSR